LRVKILVLGSAAGGGYPQWNCYCQVCSLFWLKDQRVRRRTQSSIAASVDGHGWAVLNCSPDIREQIGFLPELQPQTGPRHSPISAVVLTNGDIDHIGGLLSLRESQPLCIWASGPVLAQIEANPIFGVLDRRHVAFREISPRAAFSPLDGLVMEAFDVPGKVPLYREGEGVPDVTRNGNTVGMHLRGGNRVVSYVPGCGAVDGPLLDDLKDTDTLLFDGTLWTDDEMIASRTGSKTSRRMGHIPVSGEDGSMAKLASLRARKIFVHLNNTNPLLIDGSPERLAADRAGWIVAHDGMVVES
jgi:pyrroloquinoline quinone biosynthesis protein B